MKIRRKKIYSFQCINKNKLKQTESYVVNGMKCDHWAPFIRYFKFKKKKFPEEVIILKLQILFLVLEMAWILHWLVIGVRIRRSGISSFVIAEGDL